MKPPPDTLSNPNRERPCYPSVLVVARAHAVEKNGVLYFQNLDGPYLDRIARHLPKMTILAPVHRPTDTSFSGFREYTYRFASPNVRIVEIPDYKGEQYTLFSALKRLPAQFWQIALLAREHDAIFVMMATFRAVFGALVGRLLDKQVVLYSGNDWALMSINEYKFGGSKNTLPARLYQRLCIRAERLAMRCSDVRLLNGASLLQKYRSLPGTTVQTYPLITLEPQDLFNRTNTCERAPYHILSVANVIKRKGLHDLVDALAHVRAQGVDVRLTVVGNNSSAYAHRLRAYVLKRDLGNYIKFTGYMTDQAALLALFRQSDLFVLASLSEGFPRVLFEAMSQSLPVIATRIPNIFQRLGEEGPVQYTRPGDAEDLAQQIHMLLHQPARRQQLIAAGINYVRPLLNTDPANQVLGYFNMHSKTSSF